MNNQKGQILVMVVILAVVVILGAGFYFIKNQAGNSIIGNNPNQVIQPSDQSTVSVPAINNPQDLTTTSNNLDSTDVDGLNTQLNQNDTDAANF